MQPLFFFYYFKLLYFILVCFDDFFIFFFNELPFYLLSLALVGQERRWKMSCFFYIFEWGWIIKSFSRHLRAVARDRMESSSQIAGFLSGVICLLWGFVEKPHQWRFSLFFTMHQQPYKDVNFVSWTINCLPRCFAAHHLFDRVIASLVHSPTLLVYTSGRIIPGTKISNIMIKVFVRSSSLVRPLKMTFRGDLHLFLDAFSHLFKSVRRFVRRSCVC